MLNPDEEEFRLKAQLLGQRLEDIVGRINEVRQTARSRIQFMRGMIKPAIDKLQPPGLGRAPPQPERAETKQAEP